MNETGWNFLTNYAHVLICIAKDPNIRLRTLAENVGITERAVQRIVAELVEDGYLVRERTGRRNVYGVVGDKPLRHPVEWHCTVQELVNAIVGSDESEPTSED